MVIMEKTQVQNNDNYYDIQLPTKKEYHVGQVIHVGGSVYGTILEIKRNHNVAIIKLESGSIVAKQI